MVLKKAKEHIFLKMEINMKESGKMIKNMEMVKFFTNLGNFISDDGNNFLKVEIIFCL